MSPRDEVSTMERGAGNGNVPGDGLAALRRLRRITDDEERCELCSAPLLPDPHHEHILDTQGGRLACACTACALLFPADALGRHRRVSRRLWLLSDFEMSDMQWDALSIPVAMAFLHISRPAGTVHAHYPSPAGATESLLTLDGWDELAAANPVLTSMLPDVEALLVHRIGDAREHYIAPIDRCYALVGLIRLHWRGLSGGDAVWERIAEFFEVLRVAAEPKRRAGG